MSPASYLTAPPRVAADRVAPLPCRDLAAVTLFSRCSSWSSRSSARGVVRRLCAGCACAAALKAFDRGALSARRHGVDGAPPPSAEANAARALRPDRAADRGRRAACRPRSPGWPSCAAPRARSARRVDGGPRRGPAQVTRVAAIDLGTNSTRLLVADVDGRPGRARSCAGASSRGSAKASTPPPAAARPDRARAQRPHRLPAGARGARRRANAGGRDERGARRRERRGVPRRDRVVVRFRDAAALAATRRRG